MNATQHTWLPSAVKLDAKAYRFAPPSGEPGVVGGSGVKKPETAECRSVKGGRGEQYCRRSE
jgi:hypothetical protein